MPKSPGGIIDAPPSPRIKDYAQIGRARRGSGKLPSSPLAAGTHLWRRGPGWGERPVCHCGSVSRLAAIPLQSPGDPRLPGRPAACPQRYPPHRVPRRPVDAVTMPRFEIDKGGAGCYDRRSKWERVGSGTDHSSSRLSVCRSGGRGFLFFEEVERANRDVLFGSGGGVGGPGRRTHQGRPDLEQEVRARQRRVHDAVHVRERPVGVGHDRGGARSASVFQPGGIL